MGHKNPKVALTIGNELLNLPDFLRSMPNPSLQSSDPWIRDLEASE